MKSNTLMLGALAVAFGVSAMGQASVYTALSTGATVPGDVFEHKEDVYLIGTSLGCVPGSLPDGPYYFQVTDPAGTTVLTAANPADNGIITVTGGTFTSYVGPRATGVGACGGISVQLFPYDDTPSPGGEYKAWIIPVAIYEANGGFGSIAGKSTEFKVETVDLGEITGIKWYDTNTNGVKDPDEPVIPGWKITNSDFTTAYTDATGTYHFLGAASTLYTIAEVFPSANWVATTPTSGQVTTDTLGNGDGPDFGNVCLGGGGGKTLGFWSNKNGAALIGADDLAMLTALNLVDGSGNAFNPATYAPFRTWLLGGNATNMSYMLSVQLAAMALNVHNGGVSGGSIVYHPVLGFMTVSALMAAADAELATHPTAYSGAAWRTYQENLKTALDAANNNTNFVQSEPCAFTTPY